MFRYLLVLLTAITACTLAENTADSAGVIHTRKIETDEQTVLPKPHPVLSPAAVSSIGADIRVNQVCYPIQCASDFEGTLKHLMYKKKIGLKWYANRDLDGYHYFLNGKDENDWDEKEKEHIFLMEYWKPRAENVRKIVFLTAGQQGNLIDRMDPDNIVTGQYDGYHHCDDAPLGAINTWKYFTNATRKIQWKSMAGQIISDGEYSGGSYFGFTQKDTFMALAFDSCNYCELSPEQKDNLADDFLEWLFSKTDGQGNLTHIHLAGSSMGGGFCATLAYKLRHERPWSSMAQSAVITVSLFDAVANQADGEIWTTTTRIKNPLHPLWYCYHSELDRYFTSLDDTFINQIAGGAPAVPVVGFRYHAFHFNQKGKNLAFTWVDRDHLGIGREWHDDTTGAQLAWLSSIRNACR